MQQKTEERKKEQLECTHRCCGRRANIEYVYTFVVVMNCVKCFRTLCDVFVCVFLTLTQSMRIL